ncbi:MAG: DUF1667 domain-containing protein [Eubacteriales bacterium]|nr:DUF1667 domain-containing protein [Eubacteriales bacterium]
MEKYELTCIQCPIGCPLSVTVDGQTVAVTGNTCPRGAIYGEKEVTAPTRTVTSTVPVTGGVIARVSVKTASDVAKGKVLEVMRAIRCAVVTAPVYSGDVIVTDAAGTGVDVIATKTVLRRG